jgi:hypothetical protein
MKRLYLLVLPLLLFAFAVPSWAVTNYYISPSGSDSNNGLSTGAPWLSPNHAVNCGDVINATAGTYSASNFTNGKWGTVTCSGGNNVAWLKCTTFDTCKITSSGQDAMWVDQDYWGVTGWENSTNTSSTAGCFRATPSGNYILHHVIFANDIANGCMGGGFVSYQTSTTSSSDYITVIGSIAYNAAQGTGACYSGISVYEPLQSDTNSGTHIFVAGNYSWGNVDGACSGGKPTDGEAVNIDTLDHSQSGGAAYTQQVVVENNIGFFNGGRGFETENNSAGSSHANVYFRYNTSFGNSTDLTQTNGCFDRGELYQQAAKNVTWDHNLAQTKSGTSCSSAPYYGFSALGGDATSNISNSYWSGTSGHNTDPNTASAVLGTGNTIGTNPNFSNPINPGAPSCGSYSSVPACMAAVISDYAATSTGANAYGYQTISTTSVTDALYPAWLCNVSNLSGLVTPGCGSGGGGTVATPVISPGTEGFQASVSATITDSTTGSTIYYTQDGSTPTTSSAIYTTALTITSTTTLTAMAAASGMTNSSISAVTYSLDTPAANPVIALAGGTYSMPTTTAITDSTGGAVISYCLSSTTCIPGTTYSSAVSLTITEVLCANAIATGFSVSSTICNSYTAGTPNTQSLTPGMQPTAGFSKQ